MHWRTFSASSSHAWWLLSALFVPLTSPSAQDNGDERSLALEEVVVTAERRETTLQDIPVSVSAFDEQEIERRQAFDVEDIVNQVPNLVGSNNIGQSTATTVFLRGIGTTESIVTVDPAAAFYVDDVFIARQGVNNFSLYDVERVEVLRGPQGILHGRNTTAGAIKVFTKKPHNDFAASGEVSYGRFDRWNVKGSVNIPLIDDVLALRTTALYQTGDGYTKNITLDTDVNDIDDAWGARSVLRYTPTENLEVLLAGDYSRHVAAALYAIEVSGILTPTTDDLFISKSEELTTNIGETTGVDLTATWDITPNLQLQSITAYRNTYQEWNLDLADTNPAVFVLWTINDTDQFSQELKLNGSGSLFGRPIDWVGGLFYFDEDSFSFIGDEFRRLGLFFSRDYDVDVQSWAVYGQTEYHLTDKLRLILGGRFTRDEKSLGIETTLGATPGLENTGFIPIFDNSSLNALGIPTDLDFEEFTPKVGIQYHFTDALQGYFTFTKGFRSGGWAARTNTPDELVPFDPEIVRSFELGGKWNAFDGRARINATGFFYDQSDLFNSGTGAGGNFIVATNDAETWGIELEGTGRVSRNLDIFGSFAWQDGKFIGVDPSAVFVGDDLQRLPEFSTRIGFSYTYPVPEIGGRLRLNSDYSFTEDHFTNLQNTELARSGDIHLVSASLGYETDDGRYGVSLSCRNCADDEYIVQSLDFAGFGFITVYPGEPRTWLLTLRASYE